MPNWKLSPGVTAGMIQAGRILCQRRINVAQTGFPLTKEDLELCAVGPELLAKFHDIASYGVASFEKAARFGFKLEGAEGLERTVHLRTEFEAGKAYYTDRQQTDYYAKRWTFPLDRVPPEKLPLLAKWANNLVRETRMRAITEKTVWWFLEYREGNYGQGKHWLGVDFITAAHVMANWPALAMLVGGHVGHVDAAWRTKFASVPDKLDRWKTNHPEFIKRAKAIKLATTYLTSAEMMPSEAPKEPVTAILQDWVRLPGDPD